MYSLRVENHKGDVLNFSNNRNYSINRIEGLNPPPATVNRTVRTNAPGSKLNSVQTPERNIVIYIKPEGDIEKSRIELYKYFPQEKSVTLYFKNGSRDVRISGVVESCELCHFDMPQIAQVSIICPEPYFIDNTERQIRLSDIIALFEFPFSIPAEGIEFSAIETNTRKNIYIPSDIDTGAVIELYAWEEVVNPKLYDVTNNKQMVINVTMQPHDKIVIDTTYGNKSITLIRNGEKSNILGYIRPDSKWFVLSAGDNVFTYDCDEGNMNLQVLFTVPVLYSGV